MQQQSQTPGGSLPTFRVQYARTKQPYLSVFTVLVGAGDRSRSVRAREVLECRLQGVHLSLVLRLPSSAASSVPVSAYAAFGLGATSTAAASEASTHKPYQEEDYAVAETVLCSSAQHCQDVIARALSWYR